MIRYAKHNNISYIVVDSSMEINGIKAPLQVQISLKDISDGDRKIIFRTALIAFDRHINFTKHEVDKPKKRWWKVW